MLSMRLIMNEAILESIFGEALLHPDLVADDTASVELVLPTRHGTIKLIVYPDSDLEKLMHEYLLQLN